MKIISARITGEQSAAFDAENFNMPQIHVTTQEGQEQLLTEFYPDEVTFTREEFIGLSLQEAVVHIQQKKKASLKA